MLKETALKYLGYGNQEPSIEISNLLDECIEEIKKVSDPKVTVQKFHLERNPLRIAETGDEIKGKQMEELLEGCEECLLIGCTLGIAMERKIKFYSKLNMTKSMIMDAAASAYLEQVCDDYEMSLGYSDRTYRACPGYGDFPLEFNKRIAAILDISRKIGVTITPNHLLIPQKSMLGLIGIGSKRQKKSCGDCVMKEDCPFRKRGQRCYKTE